MPLMAIPARMVGMLLAASLVVIGTPASAGEIIPIDGSRHGGVIGSRSSMVYRQRCERSMARYGVPGPLDFICAPINSPDALYCIEGALRSGVMQIGREHTDGCSWANLQGRQPLDALYRNRYAFIRGSFLRLVASPWSYQQAQCYTTVLNRGYPQMDEFQLRSMCP